MKPIDQFSIRRQNISKILTLLCQHPMMTRQELSEASGLSLMTVTNLVDLLKAHHVLSFSPIAQPERRSGRKAENIALCSGGHAWLVVDISSQRFRYALLGFDLAPIREGVEALPEEGMSYPQRLEAFLGEVRAQVDEAIRGWRLPGVSVVTPGPYEITSDAVSNQRLPELNGVRIKALFRRCLGEYEYYVDEDVKFAVRAFASDQPECEVLYYLYIGEGVGGAAVHSGNMLRGLNAVAGDAGQLPDASGQPYESRLSLRAFAQRLGMDARLSQEELPERLQEMAHDHPAQYREALLEAAAVTAEMLFSVLWMLDPSHIVVDCRYAQPFAREYVAMIRRQLETRFQRLPRALPEITVPPQGISSVVRGAIHVLQREWVARIVS